MGNVGFSIVIPTYKRVFHLETLLVALREAASQTSCSVEVLIVDDSPSPEKEEIQSLADRFQFRYICGPKSVASKRNIGIQEAVFNYILFLDSDCRPDVKLLVEHQKALAAGEEIGGCLGMLVFSGPDSWFWNAIELTSFVVPFAWPRYDQVVPWGPTANISFRKDVLRGVGGFDETFPPEPGGEDVDLGLRVTKAGYRIVTNQEAVVYHTKETWDNVAAMSKRLYTWGKADYHLWVRHPDRSFGQIPRLIPVGVLFMLICAVLSLAKLSLWPLIMWLCWLALTLLFQAYLQHARFGYGRKSDLARQLAGLYLTLCDEAGFMSQAARSNDLRAWLYKLKYTENQQIGEWHYGSVRIWSESVALLLMVLLSVVLWH